MKRIFFAALVFFSFTSLNAQTATSVAKIDQQTSVEALSINEVHDFGTIPQGKPVYYSFQIVNKGSVPLKLENVQATCGCTTPEWNKDASIPAGGKDQIKVGYNAATEGEFTKYITLTYNGGQTKQISIKGTVWKAPAGSAPANTSVQFLKQKLQ